MVPPIAGQAPDMRGVLQNDTVIGPQRRRIFHILEPWDALRGSGAGIASEKFTAGVSTTLRQTDPQAYVETIFLDQQTNRQNEQRNSQG
jgi:hypothetical protein